MRGTIVRKPNGRYYVATHYVDEAGRRRQRSHGGFKTKREAERALTEILRRMDDGSFVAPDRCTLAEYLQDEWLPVVKRSLKASTWHSYEREIRLHVVPTLGRVHLQALTPGQLDGLYGTLLKTGRVKARAGGSTGLAPTSIRYLHRILRKAFADAVRKGRLIRNPADAADPPRAGDRREMLFWTPAEVATFLAAVAEDRFFCAWRLAAYTGMRRGEIAGLRWKDLDLEQGSLAVTQAAVAVGYAVELTSPKSSGSNRVIELDAGTVQAIKTHRTRQNRERLQLGEDYTDSGMVFAREDGNPIHPEVLTKSFQKLIKETGMRRIRLHDLRHTHVAILAQAGVPVNVIQQRLGHATAAFTLTQYGHVLPGAQSDAAAKFADAIGG